MELPDWIVDQAKPQASATAFGLLVSLFRHGRQVSDSHGDRRVYWRGTRPQLAQMTGDSKRALDTAIERLTLLGFLAVHDANAMHRPSGFSAPFDAPRGAKFAPLPVSEFRTHGGVDLSTPPFETSEDEQGPAAATPSPLAAASAAEIRGAEIAPLASAGVTNPQRWIDDFGADRCAAVLAAYERAARLSTIANPPGWMLTLLRSGAELAPPLGNSNRYINDSVRLAIERYQQSAEARSRHTLATP